MSKSTIYRFAIVTVAVFSMLFILQCSDDNPQGPESELTHDFELTVAMTANGIQLSWVEIDIAGSAGYYVYRTDDTTAGFTAVDTLTVDVTQFIDCDIMTDTTYHYCVAAFDGSGQETHTSETISIPISASTLILSATIWDCPWGGGISDQIDVTNMCQGSITGWSVDEDSSWLEVEMIGASPTAFTLTADTNFTGASRTEFVQVSSPEYGVRNYTVQQQALFARYAFTAAGTTPSFVCAADVDGDDDFDLVTANWDADGVAVIRNNGDGTFGAPDFYIVGERAMEVVAADVDGDNLADLIVRCYYDCDIFVMINQGNGTFAEAVTYESWDCSVRVVAGDFDGDGDNDIVLGYYTNDIGVLLNEGDGTFAAPVVIDAVSPRTAMGTSDLDGDDDLDIILANGNLPLMIMLNNGDATFAEGVTYDVENPVGSLAACDLDGDGDNDVVALNSYYPIVSIMLNDGVGAFPYIVEYAVTAHARAVVCGDFDGDSDIDIACATDDEAGKIQVLRNNGDATFTTPMTLPVPYKPSSMCTRDFDGDQDLDLVGAIGSLNQVIVVRNNLY